MDGAYISLLGRIPDKSRHLSLLKVQTSQVKQDGADADSISAFKIKFRPLMGSVFLKQFALVRDEPIKFRRSALSNETPPFCQLMFSEDRGIGRQGGFNNIRFRIPVDGFGIPTASMARRSQPRRGPAFFRRIGTKGDKRRGKGRKTGISSSFKAAEGSLGCAAGDDRFRQFGVEVDGRNQPAVIFGGDGQVLDGFLRLARLT